MRKDAQRCADAAPTPHRSPRTCTFAGDLVAADVPVAVLHMGRPAGLMHEHRPAHRKRFCVEKCAGCTKGQTHNSAQNALNLCVKHIKARKETQNPRAYPCVL